MTDPYQNVLIKIGQKVEEIETRRRADMQCGAGCSQCCVDGLTVLPVEAAAIETWVTGTQANITATVGAHCAFLTGDGVCQIYPARPLVCRTHGSPIRVVDKDGQADVEVCELNFIERAPAPEDVIDGALVQALLTTVNRMSYPDELPRVPLRSLAGKLAERRSDPAEDT